MKKLSATLLLVPIILACGTGEDELEDGDASVTDLGDMEEECDEDEVWLYPGCVWPDPLPTAFGCYSLCELSSDCPKGSTCVEVWYNPCPEGDCAACGANIGVCEPAS